VARGRLQKLQQKQKVEFEARPGSLFRFRVLSSQDQLSDQAEADPMVTAATQSSAKAFNALLPKVVSPIARSEFRVLQQPEPETEPVQLFLAEQKSLRSDNAIGPVELNQSNGGNKANDGSVMSMNGLKFRKGLGVAAQSRIDYQLTGQWRLLRADVGIDDSCRDKGGVQFQIFGDDKLLYDSGLVLAPASCQLLADLMLGREPIIDPAPYAPAGRLQ